VAVPQSQCAACFAGSLRGAETVPGNVSRFVEKQSFQEVSVGDTPGDRKQGRAGQGQGKGNALCAFDHAVGSRLHPHAATLQRVLATPLQSARRVCLSVCLRCLAASSHRDDDHIAGVDGTKQRPCVPCLTRPRTTVEGITSFIGTYLGVSYCERSQR